MAGLYDDLPEPASMGTQPDVDLVTHGAASQGAEAPRPERPRPSGPSPIFSLDDASLHAVLGFLALPTVGRALPAVCPLLRWLREDWLSWQRFIAPLHRHKVQVTRLLRASSRGVEDLMPLAESIGAILLQGFGVGRRRRPLGCWGVGGGLANAGFAPAAVLGQSCHYGELSMPRVLWSLHTEGFTRWRGVCALTLDARFALLPPWSFAKRRALVPPRVLLHVGISLWLPPDGIEAAHSFPGLHLNVALAEPHAFETLAGTYPEDPPCLAATCDAVLFRPSGSDASAAVLEDGASVSASGQRGSATPGTARQMVTTSKFPNSGGGDGARQTCATRGPGTAPRTRAFTCSSVADAAWACSIEAASTHGALRLRRWAAWRRTSK
eukprot:CAMPEP_0117540800 /NCGR_PEP_ID=MMETSP0784-20121206/43686_1 /TAXON_ID=39447 /ORGANISM="" /LENGTH=381 /DNA_ID=CAMNT_0005337467 /DNA_START=72 /DNA_END=1215 /DNA_ORIENTATION=-